MTWYYIWKPFFDLDEVSCRDFNFVTVVLSVVSRVWTKTCFHKNMFSCEKGIFIFWMRSYIVISILWQVFWVLCHVFGQKHVFKKICFLVRKSFSFFGWGLTSWFQFCDRCFECCVTCLHEINFLVSSICTKIWDYSDFQLKQWHWENVLQLK